MIYLNDSSLEAQDVMIPANGLTRGLTDVTFTLRSTISGEVAYSGDYLMRSVGRYYLLSVTLPSGLNAGEYAYTLADDCRTYGSGLCQIGEYQRPIQQADGGFTIKQAK